MQSYLQKTMAFLRDEEGASAIEYALLVALIALGITTAVTALGTKLSGLFNSAGQKLDSATAT
jgi:pilus assembly protein Flp/PilA